MQSLTSRAVKGVQWTTASTIITSVLQLGYTSIMSRLLDPTAFGILAVSQIILNFVAYFARMGMGSALIQKESIKEIDIRAVFTSSVLLSLFFSIIVYVSAPFANLVFPKVDDTIVPIIRVMAFSFLISGMSITASSILERELNFRLLAILEIFSYVLAYLGVGVIMAYYDFGVWSLVFAGVSQAMIALVFLYSVTRHSIIPTFKWEFHKPFFSYGSRLSLTNFVEFLGHNVTTILIGRLFGDYKLGIYRQGYMLVDLPAYKMTNSITKVVFPAFSKIQTDREKLKKNFLSSILLMSALLFPICFGASIASKQIVLVMLGEKFFESHIILQIVSIGIGFKLLTIFGGIVCNATANLNKKLIVQAIYVGLLAGSGYLFRDYGLKGFAIVITCGEIVRNISYMFLAGNILNISLKEYIKAYYPGMVNGLVSAICIYLITILLQYLGLPIIVILLAQMIVGLMVVILLTFIIPMAELKTLLRERLITLPFFKGKGKVILNYMKWAHE